MRRGIVLAIAVAVGATAFPGIATAEVPWRRIPAGWAKGPIEHVRTLPLETGTALGGVVHGSYLYVTTWRSFSIYDVSDPIDPRFVSMRDVGPQLINEGPTTNGEILLLSNDAVGRQLEVWDVTDKAAPVLAGTIGVPTNDHMWTCVLDCSYAYGSAGSIVDLSNPSAPDHVGDWRDGVPVRLPHTIEEVAPGMVVVGSLPIHYLDAREDPEDPTRIATVEPPATSPGRILPAGAPESVPGDLSWPGRGSDPFLLSSLETPFSTTCDERSGGVVVFDTTDHRSTQTFRATDTYRITTNGLPNDGQAPRHALGCSPLGIDAHPTFRGSGLVAAAWFEHGLRMLHVAPSGAIQEVGGFIGDGAESYFTVWRDPRTLYVVDMARGIDVLRVRGAEDHRPGATERISVAADGGDSHGETADPFNHVTSVSDDGRFVAFSSSAGDLVQGDTNGARDVFVRDRATGTTERVSVRSDGGQALGSISGIASTAPSISANGRFVAFMSGASNLSPKDLNGALDIFVHDRQSGATELVSIGTFDSAGSGWSRNPSISADGRYVAFDSASSDLVQDDGNNRYDVFVRDREAKTTRLVSIAEDGTAGNFDSYDPAISADGQTIAFYSSANTLVPDDGNGYSDVFVKEIGSGKTERLSVADDGTEGNDISYGTSISDDGTRVAFVSKASNLVPTDANGTLDAFVHDRASDRTRRVTVSSAGREHDDRPPRPDRPFEDVTLSATRPRVEISADGRHVGFVSLASNLAGFDVNGTVDAFVHDLATGATERVSVTSGGHERAGEAPAAPGLSRDGSVVAFATDAALTPGDGNGERDVVVRDRGAPLGIGGLAAEVDGGTAHVRGRATFSGVVARASDPVGDGVGAGGDLAAASIAYRPQRGDLLVRWEPSEMPTLRGPTAVGTAFEVRGGTIPTAAAGPAYELRITVGSRSYAVRSDAAGAMLLHCEATCARPVPLDGSFGSTGVAATAEVPLSFLGAAAGTSLSGLLATAGATGAASVDEVALGSFALPEPRVEVGLASAGMPEQEVTWAPATLDLGAFAGSVQAGGQGDHDVWARVCLGETCRARRT